MKPFDEYRDLTGAERKALGPQGLAVLRREAEAMRLEAVRLGAAVPDACGPEIAPAPGRGRASPVTFTRLYPKGAGEWEAKPEGYMGRAALRRDDVFARMEVAARRRGGAMVLTPGQVAMARHYATLVERHEGGLVKCQSFDDVRGGGADVMDAWLRERDEIDRLRARIGAGVALDLRRIRPSQRGARRPVTARALVDLVCVADMTLREVLLRHGWGGRGDDVARLAEALAGALDRMAGPVPGGLRAARFGEGGL